ncbi:MAG TPA: DoxX family protein [Xanthobacteraceae bacterium]|nr:DoxX family protein [Xanthobacteraceae bacterium]
MSILFTVGRILFVLIFIFSGVTKLMDISGTAALIATKFTVPPALADFAAQLEAATGMKTPQLLTIFSGVVEIGAALMIIFNYGARLAAFALIVFTIAATYYMHDFWNQVDPDRTENMIHALKNLSILGGLIVLFALGSWRPLSEHEEDMYPRRQEVLREEPAPPTQH